MIVSHVITSKNSHQLHDLASTIQGDPAGHDIVYVWQDGKQQHQARTVKDILQIMKSKKCKPRLNSAAISFLLHNSLIPTPMTVFENVYALGVGDRLSFSDNKKDSGINFFCDYPYFQDQSHGRSRPSEQTLLDLLCNSLTKKIKSSPVLMLSSGKDSVALALAIRESGFAHNIPAYTYADPDSDYDQEAIDAQKICQKLGLRHTTIYVPKDTSTVKNSLLKFFSASSYPSCDPTTIPYVLGLHACGISNADIIDGTRSDMSFGIMPGKKFEALYRYYDCIQGGWSSDNKLCSIVPFEHKVSKFFLSQPEVNLYRHGHFRIFETQKFYDHAMETRSFWLNIYRQLKPKNIIDNYGYVNDQFFAGCGIMPKIKTVAESLSSRAVLPWADQDVADYCFNLPPEYKYDVKTRTNKILLRQMLFDKIGYDASQYGKRIFYFNASQFIQNNIDFVKEEILECSHWNSSIEPLLNQWLDCMSFRPRFGGAILDLFMVSGWLNHAQALKSGDL